MSKISPDKRILVFSGVFSFLFALCMSVGRNIYESFTLEPIRTDPSKFFSFILEVLVTFLVSWLVFYFVYVLLTKKLVIGPSDNGLWKFFASDKSKYYMWGIIALSYIPCLLAYWPGIFAYDIPYQTQVVLGLRPLTSFQPPLHTFIWGLSMKLADFIGLESSTVYAIVSIAVMSYAFASAVKYLSDITKSNAVSLLSLLFFMLNPVIPMMAINPTKDGIMSAFLVLYIIELCKAALCPDSYTSSKCSMIKLLVLSVIICLLRNNVLYVLILSYLILLIFVRGYRKAVAAELISLVLIMVLITSCIYPLLGVGENEYAAKDTLAIPLQQISAVVTKEKDTLSEEQLDAIGQYIDLDRIDECFNPRVSDPVAHEILTFDNEGGVGGFIKIWLELLPSHFGTYVDAFLTHTIPLWYPLAKSFDPVSKQVYIATDIYFAEGVDTFERHSLLPHLLSYYEVMAYHYLIDEIPVISTIFAISTPLWIMLICITVILIKKSYALLVVMCPVLILWGSYLVAPAPIFRFVFPIVVLYPLMIFPALSGFNNLRYHSGKL